MKTSFAINCYNEVEEMKQLIPLLLDNKQVQDEIVVLYDSKNGSQELLDYLISIEDQIVLNTIRFDRKDFSHLKNTLNRDCIGDYIFNIDADEIPSCNLIKFLHKILNNNPECESFWVPRINTVKGITLDLIQIWRWQIGYHKEITECRYVDDEELKVLIKHKLIIKKFENKVYEFYSPLINPFEPQLRIYKNLPKIKWKGKVHEKLRGYRSQMYLPKEPKYSLYHHKHIDKQIKQNELYETIT